MCMATGIMCLKSAESNNAFIRNCAVPQINAFPLQMKHSYPKCTGGQNVVMTADGSKKTTMEIQIAAGKSTRIQFPGQNALEN